MKILTDSKLKHGAVYQGRKLSIKRQGWPFVKLCAICGKVNAADVTVCVSCGLGLDNGTVTGDAVPLFPSLQLGAKLQNGLFMIDEVIGQGGFGITYRGRDTQLYRTVAIKEFFPQGCMRHQRTVQPTGTLTLADYQSIKTKFMEEARTLARFNHSSIVRVFTSFEENNTAYMVMELLEGKTLQMMLDESGVLPERDVVHYAESIGEALSVVHGAGLIHRDIKPDNVFVTSEGRVVLIDFGTARTFAAHCTVRQTAMLTPGYAPLEQYGTTARFGVYSDIYALGATLYHCLTGQLPPSATDRASGVELKAPDKLNPKISSVVSKAVVWAMQFKVDERPQSIGDFMHALNDTTEPQLLEMVPPQPQGRVGASAVLPSQSWSQMASPPLRQPRMSPQAVAPLETALWSNAISDTQIETNVPPEYVLSALKFAMKSHEVENISMDFASLSVCGAAMGPRDRVEYHVAATIMPDALGTSTITFVNTLSFQSADWKQCCTQVKNIVQATNHLLRTHQFVVPEGWHNSYTPPQLASLQQSSAHKPYPMPTLAVDYANDSGMGSASSLPVELQGFNWGALFANWIWALSHQTWLVLPMFFVFWLPFGALIDVAIAFYLGSMGNELAWRNRRWKSIEHFQHVQRIWAYWGVALMIGYLFLFGYIFLGRR